MKQLLLILTIALWSVSSSAQGDGSGRVRAMRVNFLTEKMHLPAEQNARFWAVYTRYMDERSALRKVYLNQFMSNKNENLTKYQAYRRVDDNIEYKEKDLQLSKKYKHELLQVISPQQLVELYQAEREFKLMLIEKLRDK